MSSNNVTGKTNLLQGEVSSRPEQGRKEPPATLGYRLRHLIPHYRRHLPGFVLGFVLLAATSLLAAAIPFLLKMAVEGLQERLPGADVLVLVGLMVVISLLHAFLRIRGRTYIFAIGREVEYALRQAYHERLLTLGEGFFSTSRTGDLVTRGTGDITTVRMFIGPGFLQVVNTVMVYSVTLPVMYWLDPMLTLVALLPFPVVLLGTRLLTRVLYRRSRRVVETFGAFSAFAQEAVSGMAVVRAHAQEDNWRRRFDRESDAVYEANLAHARVHSLFSPLVMMTGTLGSFLLLAYGGRQVTLGHLTVGDFVAFAGYLAQLIAPTIGLGWILTVLQRGLAALERIGRILDTPADRVWSVQADARTTPKGIPARIEVTGLRFAHGEGREILSGIDLVIPAGGFVGLVGRVGSGKSTLIGCLGRLSPVQDGMIRIDGEDLNHIPEASLRARLAVAPQESFLFSATIRENLLYGRPGEQDQVAWQVAELAALGPEVRGFPNGLDTLVGERGITLSGGQRQRAAIARALAMEPDILLLDDIFASVDARTEEEILHNIRGVRKNCTLVMVCHRVAALHDADEIVVLDEGRVAARGSHGQLMAESPLYQSLHAHMSRQEALESLQ